MITISKPISKSKKEMKLSKKQSVSKSDEIVLFNINRKELLRVINYASKAVRTCNFIASSVDALSCILLNIENGELICFGTDLEHGISAKVTVSSNNVMSNMANFKCLVLPKMVSKIVSNMTSQLPMNKFIGL